MTPEDAEKVRVEYRERRRKEELRRNGRDAQGNVGGVDRVAVGRWSHVAFS
jgi:hypothetical protein